METVSLLCVLILKFIIIIGNSRFLLIWGTDAKVRFSVGACVPSGSGGSGGPAGPCGFPSGPAGPCGTPSGTGGGSCGSCCWGRPRLKVRISLSESDRVPKKE